MEQRVPGARLHKSVLVTSNRVLISSHEKREWTRRTGAVAVDMESAAAASAATRMGAPWISIRAITDDSEQDLPLDFNKLMDPDGNISASRLTLAVILRPVVCTGIDAPQQTLHTRRQESGPLPGIVSSPPAAERRLCRFRGVISVLRTPAGPCCADTCQTAAGCTTRVVHIQLNRTVPVLLVLLSLFFVSQAPVQGQTNLSLSQAIDEALRSSPQARAARYEMDAALARTGKERPDARPTMQAVASGGIQGPRVTYPGPPGSDTTVVPEEIGRIDLIIEQPIYHAGGRSARERFDAQTALVILDYRRALSAIVAVVRKLCVDLQRAESGVRVAGESVDAAQRYYNQVQQLIDAGSARPIDLQTASGQLAEAKAGIAEAESGRELAKLAINQALGATN